jgi:F0F1-type ATP synthase membrane subunit c/vacuolar-type H+-ATPase subunit K
MTSKFLKYAGLAASTLLIAFGIGAIATGIASRGTVHDTLAQEHITGSDDMTPAGIAAAVKGTDLASIALPTCSVAGKAVNDGASARCFADYMRIHTLEATGGRTYSEMGQFLTAAGKETSDKALAAKDPKTGQPAPNAARNIWVTETALATALNTSYFAESVGLFALIMGIALLLTGIGFLVVVVRWMREPASSSITPNVPVVPLPA